ncbi:hypothetical protein F4804DRAFT_353112 [Jackrogersella minutella]|nr:hypothetical protein F4804DRAFT_353112 [Jackrogersella minutella]
MSAHLQSSQVPTPLKSDSPPVGQNAFKHRLDPDEDGQEDDNPRPPKRGRFAGRWSGLETGVIKYKRMNDEAYQAINGLNSRRPLPTPFPPPESPLIATLNERYNHMRTFLHSAGFSSLEETEASLLQHSETEMNNVRQDLSPLMVQLNKLLTPMKNLKVDYTATDSSGHERTTVLDIGLAATAFADKIEYHAAELDHLWGLWYANKSEFMEFGERMFIQRAPGRQTIRQLGESSGMFPAVDNSDKPTTQAESRAQFIANMQHLCKRAVEAMAEYEANFLRKVDKEATTILQAFLSC